MPPPLNILELVEPLEPYFPFEGWVEEFAQFPWFRVAGYQEMLALAKISPRPKQIARLYPYADNAKRELPEEWTDTCPLESKDWDTFSAKQIKRAAENKLLRFDKACLAIIALDLFHQHEQTGVNVYNHVRIRPAIFKLRGFDIEFYRIIRGSVDIMSMLHHAYQNNIILVDEISAGYTITYVTATRILAFLQDHRLVNNIFIERITARPTKREFPSIRKKQPAQWEKAIIHIG